MYYWYKFVHRHFKFMNNIRNFCIIAHIDHGKSTLADRFLELTKTVEKRKMQAQYLDMNSLERERGITIKLQPVQMIYKMQNLNIKNQNNSAKFQNNLEIRNSKLEITNSEFILNLIDTPGHVDFSYEVSRSLACVEGAILLVDATKGIQAQTLANFYLAQKEKLVIIPVINKIDLPNARVNEVKTEMAKLLNVKEKEILEISAKTGQGVEKLLEEIIKKIPPPKGELNKPFRALIFDSFFDTYKGVVVYVRVVDGEISKNQKITFFASGVSVDGLEVGIFKPQLKEIDKLSAGGIGYITTGLKDIRICRVGDTVVKQTDFGQKKVEQLVGYKEPKPMVFASFYPKDADDWEKLKDALMKLKLNDAAFVFEPESSEALGRGFRCGFLGLLHLDITSERIKREYFIEPIITTPSVVYKIIKNSGEAIFINTPAQLPPEAQIKSILEPRVRLEIITPSNYLGGITKLAETKRLKYVDTQYFSQDKLLLIYEAPLDEIITDFYDALKSVTSGYASLNYEYLDYTEADLVRLDILVAGEKVEALSKMVYRPDAYKVGKNLVERLKKLIPKQLFVVSIQAAIGGKILARENIGAARKDVTGYLYGGDYTRKKKLLEKQKRGKKKMKERGRVEIPPKVFTELLKK